MNKSETLILVEQAMAKLNAISAPVTPSRLRRFALSNFPCPDVQDWLEGRPSWSLLESAAEALRRKDALASAAGDFLHISIPMLRKSNDEKRTRDVWEYSPAQCRICYRIAGAEKTCSFHNRQINEAGYRQGMRVKPLFDSIWLFERAKRRAIPLIPLDAEPLAGWLRECTPIIYPSTDVDLLGLLNLLDDSDRRDYIEGLRQTEHRRMAGLDSRPTCISPTDSSSAHAFVLMADTWCRAEQILRRGNRGGKRVGAGRPRKTEASN